MWTQFSYRKPLFVCGNLVPFYICPLLKVLRSGIQEKFRDSASVSFTHVSYWLSHRFGDHDYFNSLIFTNFDKLIGEVDLKNIQLIQAPQQFTYNLS